MPAPQSYAVDPNLQGVDSQPPSAFSEVKAITYRRLGELCSGGICTSNSCGDSAYVELSFAPPSDDQTPRSDLGYRIEWIEGVEPVSMRDLVGPSFPLSSSLTFELDFNEITQLDATIELIAIDRAGNESAPSAPIHLVYGGCTKPPVGDSCMKAGGGGCSASLRMQTPRSSAGYVLLGGLALLVAIRTRARLRASF